MTLEIVKTIEAISPYDELEKEHLCFTKEWIQSGAPIFRIEKPATPNPHLVAYFLLIDPSHQKVLLVDHKKAGLWLPAGGHVELNEHPKETVKREVQEELNIEAAFLLQSPFFLTVTQTTGKTAGHTDVSLWYLLKGDANQTYHFDKAEFHQIKWFSFTNIPYQSSDPHLKRALAKLKSLHPNL